MSNPFQNMAAQTGDTFSTGGFYTTPSTPYYGIPVTPAALDWRDSQITSLNMLIAAKETALREAYCEIGRLHEEIRGMQAFDKWSERMAQPKTAP